MPIRVQYPRRLAFWVGASVGLGLDLCFVFFLHYLIKVFNAAVVAADALPTVYNARILAVVANGR